MVDTRRSRVAIACQGGGSLTAFTAGVLQGLLADMPAEVDVVALSGTSGGAICAALAWDGFVRGDPLRGCQKLEDFWGDIAATEPWDRVVNQALMSIMSLRDYVAMPLVSPYHLPAWGEDQFRAILNRHFDFEELRKLARRPSAPALHIGAVEVLTGHFELFHGEDLCAECLMASAAIPDLYRAVRVPGRGVYWDGLFSQNPPIHDLHDCEIDELWIIQINRSTCARVPTDSQEILDRRNELSGNLSMEQELRMIEMINRAIVSGRLSGSKFRPVYVMRVPLDRDFGYRSKLDRRQEFLQELREYGRAKARWFLKERESRKYSMKALEATRSRAASKDRQAAAKAYEPEA
jgi:NTE family protein